MSCACANPATGLGFEFSRVNANFFQACTDKAWQSSAAGLRMPNPQCSLGYTFHHIYCVCNHIPLFLLHLVHFCLSPPHVRRSKVIGLATASEGEDPDFKEKPQPDHPFWHVQRRSQGQVNNGHINTGNPRRFFQGPVTGKKIKTNKKKPHTSF